MPFARNAVDAFVCVIVRPSVGVCVCQLRVCPRDNSWFVEISKVRPAVQNTLDKISRSNLI